MLGEIYYIQTGGGRRRGIPNSTFIEKKHRRHRRSGRYRLLFSGHGAQRHRLSEAADRHRLHVRLLRHQPEVRHPDEYHTAEENAKRFCVDDFAAAFVRLEGGIILDFRIAWAMHVDTPGDTIIYG